MFSRSVDVLVADLGAVNIDEDLLSVSELGRALWSGAQLIEYLAAHTWLRRRLSEYLDYPAAAFCFENGEYGKPAIAAPPTDLSFNFAYAGGMAALAVGFRREVGIDIEPVEGSRVDPKLMRRLLTPAEKRFVLASADRDQAYLRQWVRKKAFAKANGLGADQDMELVDLGGSSPVEVDGFEVTDINLGSDFVAAVAVPAGVSIDVVLTDTDVPTIAVSSSAPAAELSPLPLVATGR